jgi:hypothetical protein
MKPLPTRPSLAAERMRRHRQRQRDGLRCLVIELHETEVDVLVQRGLLKAEMRNDASAIIEALYDYLYHTMASCCEA